MTQLSVNRYRHRSATDTAWVEGQGLVWRSLCGKVWTPIVSGQAARRYPPCPVYYRKPLSRARVIA